jgi:cell division protein FtsW
VLLLAEPDFGAATVLMATGLVVLFLAGARLLHLVVPVVLGVAALAALAVTSPYRLRRLIAFRDPWQDPFDSGFQLTQSLIAIGRGEWFGVGLGSSVQKLFYLPEAHTDFVFAVLAEAFGFVGVLLVLGLFGLLVGRALVISRNAARAGLPFQSLVAASVGVWLASQALINMGVNMGLLPTKGLTLPFLSFGGTGIVMNCVCVAILLRIDFENRYLMRGGSL